MMKRLLLQLKVGFLVIIGVALVLATGYMSYTGISSIVENINKENQPDVKLPLIQSLATDLGKAESGIRLYTYSKNRNDLKAYQTLINNVDDQLFKLRQEGEDNVEFLANMDTVTDLVEKKIRVWNEMLPLYDTKQAEQYLDTISKELENKLEKDSLRKKRSIFKKIFQRAEKVEIDEKKIIRDIEEVKEDKQQVTEQIKAKERQLALTNSKLTDQLYDLLQKIQDQEEVYRKQKAEEADLMATETYQWIGWFALSATLALLVVIFVISRYIRKSGHYTDALIKARDEAETLARTKEMFVANVSHEVRTPMSVISGFVEQLLKKPHDKNTGETLKIIKSSSDHLVRIINDILDFSKLESGKMKLEPVHFDPYLAFKEIVLLFENQAKNKGIQLESEISDKIPDVLVGDPIRLKQILINLLGNAIKFTEKGKVSLKVYPENLVQGHADINFVIKDTGIGIAPEKLDLIFDDFAQAEDGTSRKFGGTGLGLSIVKKLVELHHGKITVKSEMGLGTEFYCHIHYLTGDKSRIADVEFRETEVPEKIKNLNILVADDEEYNRKLIGSILKKWGVNFDEVKDGKEAIESCRKKKYDIVLMDKSMPVTDGLQASKMISKKLDISQSSKPTIILITASTLSGDIINEYKKEGIDDYLPKPFTEDELLKTILKTRMAEDDSDLKEPPVIKSGGISMDKDFEQLYRVAGNDESFVFEMLEKFIESFESGYEKMLMALEKKDYAGISSFAHKLASPCRHISADRLLSVIKEIENATISDSNGFNYKSKMDEALSEFQLVQDKIHKHIKK